MKKLHVKAFIFTLAFLFPFFCYAEEASVDSDQDGLSDQDEINIYFTDPNKVDTDGDGYNDGLEIKNRYSPLVAGKKLDEVDTDKDYLNDDWEIKLGTNLKNADSDGDKYLDGTEVKAGFDPLNSKPVKVTKKIEVEVAKYRLQYYFGDKMLEDIPISGGKASTPTPKGDFEILAKIPVKHYGGATYNYPNTKWNLHFATTKYRYYIHGAYWHDKFGKAGVSAGCVNVRYEDMELLYWWAQGGTKLRIT